MEPLIVLKGIVFGICISLPIGGAAMLIIRQVYMKGRLQDFLLPWIPLSFDWVSIPVTLFILKPQGEYLLHFFPSCALLIFGCILKHINLLLVCALLYVSRHLWKHRHDAESQDQVGDIPEKIRKIARINLITVPLIVLAYHSKIFSSGTPTISERLIFFVMVILGSVFTWGVTVFQTSMRRKKNIEIDQSKTNTRFAVAVAVCALMPLSQEVHTLVSSYFHFLNPHP